MRRLRASHGVLDLSDWNPERDGPAELSGEWLVHWGEALSPYDLTQVGSSPSVLSVPTRWPVLGTPRADREGVRAASFRISLRLPEGHGPLMLSMGSPNAVHSLWIDGKPVLRRGELGSSAGSEEPAIGDYLVQLPGEAGTHQLLLQVASHFTRTLWLRTAPVLGTPAQILDARAAVLAWPALLFGVLCIAALYHLGIYVHAPGQTAQLVFGSYCLSIALRQVLAGPHCVVAIVFPELSYRFVVKLEYVCLSLSMLLGLVLMRRLYPRELGHLSIRLWELVALLFCAESLLFPLPWCMRMLPAFQLSGFLALSTVAYRLGHAVRNGRPFARIILVCVFLYMAGGVHDALVTNGKIGAWAELQAPSLLLFLCVQAWALASSYAGSQQQVHALSRDLLSSNHELSLRNRELTLTNESVARFVPHGFLAQLERGSIREVQRGDHAIRHMEVLFCDVRGFTGIVERMQPGEAFAFINDFLSFMEPVIHRHGGFINQYLGDCIMALFPNGADAALSAAVDMRSALVAFNARAAQVPPVAMGIGINSGPLMLGTIGGEHRLASGVVGDAVNLAARLEQLTKDYGAPIILSELTVQRLTHPRHELRLLDLVTVRGKTRAICIYECLDGLADVERAAKLGTRAMFECGVQSAIGAAHAEALESFAACLRACPEDRAAQLQHRRCLEALRMAPTLVLDEVS